MMKKGEKMKRWEIEMKKYDNDAVLNQNALETIEYKDVSYIDNNNGEKDLVKESLESVIKDLLFNLSPREAKILMMRFGIGLKKDHTLEEVARQFDVTRERIRQIEARALRKLRHPSRAHKLQSFLE